MKSKGFTKRFYLNEKDPKAYIELFVRPGRHTIELDRIEADVLHAKAGRSLSCMNSICANRGATEGKFPHPVYGVVFDTSMAYVVDKVTPGRQWKSVVRYRHNDRNAIKIHDRVNPKEIIKLGMAVKKVVLSPPLSAPTRSGYKGQNGTSRVGGRPKLVIPTGTRRRAMEAGLLLETAI